MKKQELRTVLREKRNQIKNREELSNIITENILLCEWFLNATTVMLYRSAKNEVITDFLWEKCREMGKICLFPKCISKTEMIAVLAEEPKDFSCSSYGILEPVSSVEYPKEQIDVILVPGLGFDRAKYRIGYGAGYYDRYLADYQGISCGLCYQALLCESVYPDAHDIALTYIASEEDIF